MMLVKSQSFFAAIGYSVKDDAGMERLVFVYNKTPAVLHQVCARVLLVQCFFSELPAYVHGGHKLAPALFSRRGRLADCLDRFLHYFFGAQGGN